MEKLALAQRALQSLDEVLKEPYSVIVRDATIQRFEYTSEAVWKATREWLLKQESIEENHPRGCYRALFRIGQIEESLSLQLMATIDDRNRTSHAHIEDVAVAVFERIPAQFGALRAVIHTLQ